MKNSAIIFLIITSFSGSIFLCGKIEKQHKMHNKFRQESLQVEQILLRRIENELSSIIERYYSIQNQYELMKIDEIQYLEKLAIIRNELQSFIQNNRGSQIEEIESLLEDAQELFDEIGE